jgi:hypothetical protein
VKMSVDPTYCKIIDRRRRERRLQLSVVLLITGTSMLLTALFRQSISLTVIGSGALAIAGQLLRIGKQRTNSSSDYSSPLS